MIGALRTAWDSFRGSGAAALTIPPMDGAFRPNMVIENAAIAAVGETPDNLAVAGDALYYSDGGRVMRLGADGQCETVASSREPITALAGRADGALAVARRSSGLSFIGGSGSVPRSPKIDCGRGDVTALTFLGDDKLVVAVGSEANPASAWREDLMQKRRAGAVWTCDLATGAATKLAGDLAYPCGIAADELGRLVVSEAWATRLVRLLSGGAKAVVDNLPGYPCRLSAATGGGYWLALFAPRNQLVEFVLREKEFRSRMMDEIAAEYWVSPSLVPHDTPLSPMQEGGQKIGGAIKPWAPAFSYGLVARLDRDLQPQSSLHSRANGRRHGVTSVAEHRGRLFASSRGVNAIVEIAL